MLPYGEPLQELSDGWPDEGGPGTRLYGLAELEGILGERGMRILAAYGDYDTAIPASADHLMLVVCSQKAGLTSCSG